MPVIHAINLPKSFKAFKASMALGQLYECPSASEVALKDMDKLAQTQTTTNHNQGQNMCIILMVYF